VVIILPTLQDMRRECHRPLIDANESYTLYWLAPKELTLITINEHSITFFEPTFILKNYGIIWYW